MPNTKDRSRAGKPELRSEPPADSPPQLAKPNTKHTSSPRPHRGRGVGGEGAHPPACSADCRLRIAEFEHEHEHEHEHERRKYAPPRTRTQSALADGTRTRTRKTHLHRPLSPPTAFPFASSRLRVTPTASKLPAPAAICRHAKHKGQISGWKARATKQTTRRLPSAARQTEHQTLFLPSPPPGESGRG